MNIINLRKIADEDGTLVPFSLWQIIDFVPKRIFYVKDVPAGTERGNHAHYKTIQFLICVKGSIKVKLYDGTTHEQNLLQENQGVLVENMIWDSQVFVTGQDILLVLCSTEYDRADYIEELHQFETIKNAKETK